MGLFDNIRSKTDTTTARLLFGAVVVVFVFSFIGSGMGGRTATYATVNGSRITDLDLQKRMRMVQRQMQSSSMNEDEMEQLKNDILERLVVEKSVMDKAEDLQVEVSDDEISLILLQNPGFKDAAGDFSTELYAQAVKQEGYGSKAKYEDRLREDLTYAKLREQVINTVYVSDQEAQKQAEQVLTTLAIEWIRLSQNSVDVTVSEEDIQGELDANKTEIEAQYTTDLPIYYQKGERVTFQKITLPFTAENKEQIAAQGKEILAALESGTTFEEQLTQYNPGAFNNGLVIDSEREQLSVDVADAIFAMTDNAFASIETDNAVQVVKLITKKDAETISIEVASKDIAKARATATKQKEGLSSKANEVLEAWKTGFTPEQSALYPIQQENNISMTDPKISGLGNNPDLFKALGDVDSTGWLQTSFTTLGGVILVNVTNIQAPTPEQLTERAKIEKMRLKIERQRALWDAFESNARNTASVEEHWKGWE